MEDTQSLMQPKSGHPGIQFFRRASFAFALKRHNLSEQSRKCWTRNHLQWLCSPQTHLASPLRRILSPLNCNNASLVDISTVLPVFYLPRGLLLQTWAVAGNAGAPLAAHLSVSCAPPILARPCSSSFRPVFRLQILALNAGTVLGLSGLQRTGGLIRFVTVSLKYSRLAPMALMFSF